jgi:hypothetical protein
MSDQSAVSNPEDKEQENREARINKAFGSLKRADDEPLSKQEEERVLGIREAAATGDRAKVEEHLASAKSESNWLYEELIKHPEIAAILQELSIMGF